MNPFPYAVWLMPCAEQIETLQEMIDLLAAQFRRPRFPPHMTLCSGVWKQKEEGLVQSVNRLVTGMPVKLTANGIDWTDHWSTFFFLRLQGAQELCRQAERLIGESHLPKIGPHLSLLYGNSIKTANREALRTELNSRLPENVLFDLLALVCPKTGCWQDVAGWKKIRTIDFSDKT